jgi:hypothetical protein
MILQLAPLLLATISFIVFYAPRMLIPLKSDLIASEFIKQRPDLQQVVQLYPIISLGYFVVVSGICAVLVIQMKLTPYPAGLSIFALFWSGLGVSESLFALFTKVMSASNRIQYRYLVVDNPKTVWLLKIQCLSSCVIIVLVILYLFFSIR